MKVYLFITDDLTDIEVDLEESAGSDNYSVEDSNESDVNNDDALQLNEQGQRVLSKEFWKKVTMQTIERIPHDIDNVVSYSVKSNSRISLLGKCRDGRPWKPDSRTNWAGYESTRYRNCGGSLVCPNNDCPYKKELKSENRINFDHCKCCKFCGALGENVECPARKYTAFRGQEAHIYHVGKHTCLAKATEARPVELVSKSMAVNPNAKPAAIQGNAILTEMRNRKPWSEVESIVKKVANKRAVANEKAKQKRQILPKGVNFNAVSEYKKSTDEKDSFLVYEVDENNQVIFKTSRTKMNIANEMQIGSNSILANKFCCFDGKVHRTKAFTTLDCEFVSPSPATADSTRSYGMQE